MISAGIPNEVHVQKTAHVMPDVRLLIEAKLSEMMASTEQAPANLRCAMQHALLAPGKRLRPQLLYLIAEPNASLADAALSLGCSIEMIHTASLVLDDLPCMDDAKTRRERPTTHLAYGQSTAILSAIALLTRAFGVIAELTDIPADVRARLASVLSDAVGHNGLVAGQEIDLNGRNELVDRDEIEKLNWLKTGALFVAAAEMGAILRGLPSHRIEAVRRFATHLGLAFQTVDDLLDMTASAEEIGKDVLKDGNKATLVSIFDAKRARMSCRQHLDAAEIALLESDVTPAPIQAIIAKHFRATISAV